MTAQVGISYEVETKTVCLVIQYNQGHISIKATRATGVQRGFTCSVRSAVFFYTTLQWNDFCTTNINWAQAWQSTCACDWYAVRVWRLSSWMNIWKYWTRLRFTQPMVIYQASACEALSGLSQHKGKVKGKGLIWNGVWWRLGLKLRRGMLNCGFEVDFK